MLNQDIATHLKKYCTLKSLAKLSCLSSHFSKVFTCKKICEYKSGAPWSAISLFNNLLNPNSQMWQLMLPGQTQPSYLNRGLKFNSEGRIVHTHITHRDNLNKNSSNPLYATQTLDVPILVDGIFYSNWMTELLAPILGAYCQDVIISNQFVCPIVPKRLVRVLIDDVPCRVLKYVVKYAKIHYPEIVNRDLEISAGNLPLFIQRTKHFTDNIEIFLENEGVHQKYLYTPKIVQELDKLQDWKPYKFVHAVVNCLNEDAFEILHMMCRKFRGNTAHNGPLLALNQLCHYKSICAIHVLHLYFFPSVMCEYIQKFNTNIQNFTHILPRPFLPYWLASDLKVNSFKISLTSDLSDEILNIGLLQKRWGNLLKLVRKDSLPKIEVLIKLLEINPAKFWLFATSFNLTFTKEEVEKIPRHLRPVVGKIVKKTESKNSNDSKCSQGTCSTL